MRALTLARAGASLARIHAFEAVKTFLWFTVLPVGRVTERLRGDDPEFRYEISVYQYYYLGFVGLAKFGLAFGIVCTAGLIWPPAVACVMGAVAYVVVSGGIHLDGLSDTFDALFAYGKDRWEVMKDPHIGALGAAYMTLFMWAFVPIFACNLWWASGHGWSVAAALAGACVLPKVNCYAILNDHVSQGTVNLDRHFVLDPAYEGWQGRPLTNGPVFYGVLAIVTLGWVAASGFTVQGIIYVGATFSVMAWFNTRVVPRVCKTLGFLAGDVFGWQICLVELALQLTYAVVFVRA